MNLTWYTVEEMELQNLLTVAKQTRDAREAWDQQQANQGIVSQG